MLTTFALRLTNKPNLYVFGAWKEAGASGENPQIHGENIQTPQIGPIQMAHEFEETARQPILGYMTGFITSSAFYFQV